MRRDRKMARKRRSPVRYARARKVYTRARTSGGAMKPIIDGFGSGVVGAALDRFLPTRGLGQPLAAIGVGYFRNNVTLKTEGARELGAALVSMFTGNGGGATNGGGY